MCWFVDWICIMALLLTEDVMNNPWRAKVAKKAKWFPAFLFLCPFVFVLSFCLSVCLVLLSPFCSRLCLVLLIEERNPAFGNSNVTISIAAEFLIWLDVIKEKKKKKKKEKKKETITKNWNSVLKWIFETANQIASKDRQPIKRGKRRPRSEIVASTDRLLSAGINLIRLVGRLVNLSHSGLVIGFWSDSLVRNPDGSFFKPISHLHFRLIISFLGAHFEFHPWIHRINPLARSHWRESTTCLQFTTLIYNFILICACVCVCVCVLFERYQSERVARRQPVQSHQFRQSHQSYCSVAAVLEALSIAQRGASVMILTRRRRYELKRHFEFRFLNVFCAPERKSRTSECSVDPDASVVRSWSRRLFAPS